MRYAPAPHRPELPTLHHHHYSSPDTDTAIEIGHVLVHHADAAGRHVYGERKMKAASEWVSCWRLIVVDGQLIFLSAGVNLLVSGCT